MRRSAIVVLNKFSLLNYFKKNRILLLLSAFFILGIVLGVMLLKSSDLTDSLARSSLEAFINMRKDKAFFYIFVNSFLVSLVFIFVSFLSGTSIVGIVLSPILVLIRGYLYGSFLGYIYAEQALKGIAFTAIIFIPQAVFFLICLLLCARESISFSYELARLMFERNYAAGNIFDYFRNYCGRYLFLLILLIVSALVDATFSKLFLSYFNF